MIEVCSLSSGSNGNCFYVRTGSQSFLVDAGISCKQILLRLEHIGSSIQHIAGIFVTHEHSDHTCGLRVLLKKHPMPVYITEKTYRYSHFEISPEYLHLIDANERININDTVVQALPKSHDAVEPTLFCFYYKNIKISIITDIGYACENVIAAVRDAHVIFLESNYDDSMLWYGGYPPYLKERIAGNHGHLSNLHAGELILNHASQHLSHVFLAHLSENSNTPDIALNTFLSMIQKRHDLSHVNTLLTSRVSVSPVVRIK